MTAFDGFVRAPQAIERHAGEVLSTLVIWVEAMQGRSSVHKALRSISDLAGCDAISLCRCLHTEETIETIAVYHNAAGKIFAPTNWEPTFPIRTLRGAVSGSSWTLSDLSDDDTLSFRRAGEAPSKEVVFVVLESDTSALTGLELCYAHSPFQTGVSTLAFMSEQLSQTWRRRIHGIDCVSTLRLIENESEVDELQKPSILTFENPFDLSKTEFRICMLLSSGASIKEIASSSGIREKTVRTHLSTIYSKVGVQGQLQLLHQLMEDTRKSA